MKILIVNGYKDTTEGLKAFLGFRYLIQKILIEQTIIMDMESEFVIRRMEDLDDVLYESTSSNNKMSSGKNFDSFDMIFITGEPHYRAWSKVTLKVSILIRMCLRARKFLFASSFAMETLVFQAATNFDRSVTIINGDEGGKVTDMPDFATKLTSLAPQDFFLDNTTGDLYTYRNDQQEWSTKVNAGLHNSHTVQKYSTIGKFIVKAPVYRANKVSSEILAFSGGQGIISKRTEVRCYIKTQYSLHWAFEGMTGNHFISQKKSKWDIHPFSFMCKETSFVTLAESDQGPLIIQFDDFILGCQYEIIPKYFESIIPMKNFMYNKLVMISENRQSKLSILSVNANSQSIVLAREINGVKAQSKMRFLSFDKLSTGSSASKRAAMKQFIADGEQNLHRRFQNSGLAASKKNIGILVSENAVSSNNVIKSNPKNSSALGGQNFLSFEDILTSKLQELGLDNNQQDVEEEEDEPITVGQVRRMLHPFLSKECYQETSNCWIPGMTKLNEKKGTAIRIKQDEIFKGHFYKKISRGEQIEVLPRSVSVMQLSRGSTSQRNQNERRSSIFINVPYQSLEEQRRQYEKKEQEKNIGPTKLNLAISKSRVHSNLNANMFSTHDALKPILQRNTTSRGDGGGSTFSARKGKSMHQNTNSNFFD